MASRRRFLRRFVLGAVALPLLRSTPARADDLPHLKPDEPTAKALSYTENAATVDAKKESLFQAGRQCVNCKLLQIAQAKGDYAPCLIFPGKVVNRNGWCRAWAAIPKAP